MRKYRTGNLDRRLGGSGCEAVVGNIGSTQRMEFTATGDTGNVASRLQAQTQTLGVETLVSEYTHVEVRNVFRTREMGIVEIRRRSGTLRVYSVGGGA